MIEKNEFLSIAKDLGSAIKTADAAHTRINKVEERIEDSLKEIKLTLFNVIKKLEKLQDKASFNRGFTAALVLLATLISGIAGYVIPLLLK